MSYKTRLPIVLSEAESMARLHNRYLPQWVHRIANGLMASMGIALVGALGASTLACDSFLWKACFALLCASPAGLLLSCADPAKITLVEGIAGEDGYDELEEGYDELEDGYDELM
jgi:hypothetical protein